MFAFTHKNDNKRQSQFMHRVDVQKPANVAKLAQSRCVFCLQHVLYTFFGKISLFVTKILQ